MVHRPMRLLVLAASGWLGGQIGCSLAYDTGRPQCVSSRDCLSLAETRPELDGSSCLKGVCVVNAGQGGQSGGGSDIPCTRHADCMVPPDEEPYICRDGACIALRKGDCSLVLHGEELRVHDEVILLGAFAGWKPVNQDNSPSLASYQLAMDEFSDRPEGIGSGADGAVRPFVGVVCQAENSENLDASVDHLTKNLQVPVVIAALPAQDLYAQFKRVRSSTKTFFLSPNSSTTELIGLKDKNRPWHMLGPAGDLGPGYQSLAKAVIDQIVDKPVRVAMVVNELWAMQDMADSLFETLQFNNTSLKQNSDDGNYKRFQVNSASTSGDADNGTLLSELTAFEPHVILALAGSEFVTDVVIPLETTAPSGLVPGWEELKWGNPPWYVMSPYTYNDSSLYTMLSDDPSSSSTERIVGVNFAAAVDQTLNENYYQHLLVDYPEGAYRGYENFYDATYFAMFSVAAAGKDLSNITGDMAAAGIRRLVDPLGDPMYITRNSLTDILEKLRLDGTTMYLTGAMGPPEFDANGVRKVVATVWCMKMKGTVPVFVSDTTRYDSGTSMFVGADGKAVDPLAACAEVL
jgi:hypothetical protein